MIPPSMINVDTFDLVYYVINWCYQGHVILDAKVVILSKDLKYQIQREGIAGGNN